MEIHQLRTFAAVAREGSVTRASEILHLSQPAVSAHIKAIEDALGVALFARTPRGMSLTSDGRRLLAKTELALGAHQELMHEASRIKGRLAGKLRLGAGSHPNDAALGRLLAALAERHPDVDVALEHRTSSETLAAFRSGALDAGYCNEAGEPDADLATIDVSRFAIHLAARPGLVPAPRSPDGRALAELTWIYPRDGTCCARAAERLFEAKGIRPKRVVRVDAENVTRALVAGGVGVGLLHADVAEEARAAGEVELLGPSPASTARVLFVHLASRAEDPLLRVHAANLRPRWRAIQSFVPRAPLGDPEGVARSLSSKPAVWRTGSVVTGHVGPGRPPRSHSHASLPWPRLRRIVLRTTGPRCGGRRRVDASLSRLCTVESSSIRRVRSTCRAAPAPAPT